MFLSNAPPSAQPAIFNFDGASSRSCPNKRRNASVQPSLTRSSFTGAPVIKDSKLVRRSFCQPLFCVPNQSGSVGWLLRTLMEEGVR